MSLSNVDMESALRRLAERRIEDAMREGKFDNLSGKGKPLDLEPVPAEEDARLMWWALRIMKNNNFTPDEVQIRKQVDALREQLEVAPTEPRVKFLCTAINAAVKRLNSLGTNAINLPIAPVSMEAECARFRERIGQDSPAGTP